MKALDLATIVKVNEFKQRLRAIRDAEEQARDAALDAYVTAVKQGGSRNVSTWCSTARESMEHAEKFRALAQLVVILDAVGWEGVASDVFIGEVEHYIAELENTLRLAAAGDADGVRLRALVQVRQSGVVVDLVAFVREVLHA
jgi:hypothetical protein